MNKEELTKDFFQETTEPSKRNVGIGNVGSLGLHLVHLMVVGYCAYSAIALSDHFSDHNSVDKFWRIAGFLSAGVVIMGIYLMYMGKKLNDRDQKIVACCIYLLCLVIDGMAVLIHRQIVANGAISSSLQWYLMWIQPFAPILVGVGAGIVHVMDGQSRDEQQVAEEKRGLTRDLTLAKHRGYIANERAELEHQKMLRNAQLNAQAFVAGTHFKLLNESWVVGALRENAQRDLPALLRAVGIDLVSNLTVTPTPSELLLPTDSPTQKPRRHLVSRGWGKRPPKHVQEVVEPMKEVVAVESNTSLPSAVEEVMKRIPEGSDPDFLESVLREYNKRQNASPNSTQG